jgi:hypothetical protein
MRKERGGQRRSNRGGGGRSPRGGRGQRGRGDRHGRRHPRQSAESGNQRERIAIESGDLVLIDQFMLANPQFIEKMASVIDESAEVKSEIISEYGGKVITVTCGTYRIERDPFAYTIVVHPEGDSLESPAELVKDATDTVGEINVDTRCLAMLDRELLDDSSLLERYQQLWFSGQDKACRDLLRDNGGAVRYGFRRDGDELGIFQVPGEDVICLWPKNIEELKAESAQSETAGAAEHEA